MNRRELKYERSGHSRVKGKMCSREEAIASLPKVTSDWLFVPDAVIAIYEKLVEDGIARRKGNGFQRIMNK